MMTSRMKVGWFSAVIFLVTVSGFAQERIIPEKLELGQSCVTSDCHGDLMDRKYQHEILSECVACHEHPEETKHEFVPIEEIGEHCQTCHEPDEELAVVHFVYPDLCLECHDPHSSETELLLKFGGGEALCNECHDGIKDEIKNLHGPMAVDACSYCHLSHQSADPWLLKEPANQLCLACHEETKEAMAAALSVHTALQENQCTDCHLAHGGDEVFILNKPRSEICKDCHENLLQQWQELPVQHQGMMDPPDCQQCHLPHVSDLDVLLKGADTLELCLHCHAEDQQTSDGRIIPSVKQAVLEAEYLHLPVEEKACELCHLSHGSEHSALLIKPFPRSFYAAFELEKYQSCFECHDEALVLDEESEDTEFRNGTQNMHFLHVNREKGRSCSSCHDPHGAAQAFLVSSSVRFGNWDMTIAFENTETGGGCLTGCHQMYRYDREQAVINIEKRLK